MNDGTFSVNGASRVSIEFTHAGLDVKCDGNYTDGVNVSPFFSSLPWSDSNPYWNSFNYTSVNRQAYVTNEFAADGWCTLVLNPDSTASNTLFLQSNVALDSTLEYGELYTLMIEVKDCTSNDTPITWSFSADTNNVLTPIVPVLFQPSFRDSVTYHRFVSKGITASTSRLLRLQIERNGYLAPFTGKTRLPLYKGDYQGSYVPYRG